MVCILGWHNPLIRSPFIWRIIPFRKWLLTMVIVSPLRIGLWDPFQMAIHGLYMGVILTTYKSWDDPLVGGYWQGFLYVLLRGARWLLAPSGKTQLLLENVACWSGGGGRKWAKSLGGGSSMLIRWSFHSTSAVHDFLGHFCLKCFFGNMQHAGWKVFFCIFSLEARWKHCVSDPMGFSCKNVGSKNLL